MSRERDDGHDPTLDARSALVLERAQRDVGTRQVEAAVQDAVRQRPWRWVCAGLVLAWVLGVLLWPAGTVIDRLRLLVRGVCDQVNNIPTTGVALPLDARCTGIYTGVLTTVLYLVGQRRLSATQLPQRDVLTVLVGAGALMALDGVNSLLSQYGVALYQPHTSVRLATGLAAGIAAAMLGVPLFNAGLRARARQVKRRVAGWVDLLVVAVVTAVIGIAAWQDWAWLFYPLAVFSVIGLLLAVFLINLAAVALVSGLRRRVLVWGQLARPAVFALVLTATELTLLGRLRDG